MGDFVAHSSSEIKDGGLDLSGRRCHRLPTPSSRDAIRKQSPGRASAMKVVITGATRTAGSEVLRQALADREITDVLVLSRRPTQISDLKLKVALLDNFLDYSALTAQFADYDACLWCLGISQNDVSKEEQVRITYDYTLAAARAMRDTGDNFRFCFLSGAGADTTEKSSILFARIKGRTKNALTSLTRPKAWHFRPGYIHAINTPPKKWWSDGSSRSHRCSTDFCRRGSSAQSNWPGPCWPSPGMDRQRRSSITATSGRFRINRLTDGHVARPPKFQVSQRVISETASLKGP